MRTGIKSTIWAITLLALTSSLQLVDASAQIVVIACDNATPGSSSNDMDNSTPVTVFESDTTIACDDEPGLDSSIHITAWECDESDQGSDRGALLSECEPNTRTMMFMLRDDGALFGRETLEDGEPTEVSFDVPNTGYVHIAGAPLESGYVGASVFCSEVAEATPTVAGSLSAFDEMTLDDHFLIFEDGLSDSADTPVHLDCHWFSFYE
jgi:hypothetical protein